MSAVGLLQGHKAPHDSRHVKTYVLQFPNPFDQNNKDLHEKITLGQARKQYFRVFKTSKKIQRPHDVSKHNKGETELKHTEQKHSDSHALPNMIKTSVDWLYNDKGSDHHITRQEFLLAIISGVLFTIQYELNLHYTLLESRDKDEIFCEISASEEWLEKKAQSSGYRLQFRQVGDEKVAEHIEKYPFKAVPPYAKFEIPEIFQHADEAKAIFKHFDVDEVETNEGGSLFTYNDRVRLIRSSLNTRLDLHIMKEYNISIEDFCLHSEQPLALLRTEWATLGQMFAPQPLDKIRNYFGEKAALYFAWMETYKSFMISAGILGILVQAVLGLAYLDSDYKLVGQITQVVFALFLAFWASTFDQLWTRKEKILAWKWGATNFYEEEEQRGEFTGPMERDPVTNKMKRKRVNLFWHNFRKFISYSVISVVIVSVLAMIWGILFLRFFLISEQLTVLGMILGGALNAVQIRFMNIFYDKLAELLNDWENHETETEYNNLLAVKVFVFRFVNSYSSLFYLAFYADDAYCGDGTCMEFLSIQLMIIFFVSIVLNAIEIFVPWALMKRRLIAEDLKISSMREKNPELRENLYPVERQAKFESYESPLQDYIEMIIEFGYVAMFGTALPVLPLLLLLEIIVEIRVDAWKICNICKRADPHRSEDIGVFKDIIVIMAYAGAINNAGLIVFTSGIMNALFPHAAAADTSVVTEAVNSTVAAFAYLANSTDVGTIADAVSAATSEPAIAYGGFEYLISFVALEHVLLFGMFLISVIIPDDPEVVSKGLIWSERIINERLYQTPTSIKISVGLKLATDAIEEAHKQHSKKFMLKEKRIKYREE